MEFNLKDPNNKPIVDFLAGAQILIMDQTSSSRASIRRLMSTLGAKTANVDIAENYNDAVTKIKQLRPIVLFSDFSLGDHTGIELQTLQQSVLENPLNSTFIVLTDSNSPVITSAVAEADADGLVNKPFAFQGVQDIFLDVIKSKLKPTEYNKKIFDAKSLLAQEKWDEALEMIDQAIGLDPKPSKAFFQKGFILKKKGQLEEAIEAFQKGLEFDSNHYRCLYGLFDCLQAQKKLDEAYDLGQKIALAYPIPPQRLVEFIQLSIRTGHYEDILKIYEMLSTLANPDEASVTAVAAGFVIYAKTLLKKGDPSTGLDLLKKALSLCRGKQSIQRQIVLAMIGAGLVDDAEVAMGQMPDEIRNAADILEALIEQIIVKGDLGRAYSLVKGAFEKGLKTKRMYEHMVVVSVKAGRPEASLSSLVSEASAAYPDHAAAFKGLLQN